MGSASLKKEPKGTKTLFLWLFLGCLFFSLLVHLCFFIKSQSWRVTGFSATNYDTIVPRTFRMKRVEIDPKVLAEEVTETVKKRVPQSVVLEKEQPGDQNILTKEAPAPLLTKPADLLPEGREGSTQGGYPLEQLQTLNSPAGELASKESAILMPKARDTDRSLPEPEGISAGKDEPRAGEGNEEGVKAISGGNGKFSNLDQLLSGNTTVSAQTAPILMPTDLLFEYDSDSLKPAAAESLTKLGALIEKNAQANFRIEGHTDSYGSDEYNKSLSLRRAEAVKVWLQQRMGIEAGRITTAGLGKSRLLVPATGTVQEQQLNRRVEIVISTH